MKLHESGCWLWEQPAALTSNGYARASIGGKKYPAHRMFYEILVGPLFGWVEIDHICHTNACHGGDTCPHRRCVNPAHLRPASRWENTLRSDTASSKNKAKTHCPRGHEYNTKNTKHHGGRRYCRPCQAARARRLRAERAATR